MSCLSWFTCTPCHKNSKARAPAGTALTQIQHHDADHLAVSTARPANTQIQPQFSRASSSFFSHTVTTGIHFLHVLQDISACTNPVMYQGAYINMCKKCPLPISFCSLAYCRFGGHFRETRLPLHCQHQPFTFPAGLRLARRKTAELSNGA